MDWLAPRAVMRIDGRRWNAVAGSGCLRLLWLGWSWLDWVVLAGLRGVGGWKSG
jgi:hypothetical protein